MSTRPNPTRRLPEHPNLEQLRKHGGQPQPKRRVVLEDESQQKAMGWITAAMFGMILLVGIGMFAFPTSVKP